MTCGAGMALAALLSVASVAACAQQVVSDPAPFRRPAFFVTPDAPQAVLQQHDERAYTLVVSISDKGTVTAVTSLVPDDAEFRQQLARVTSFWLFYPKVDVEACAATASQAKVELVYRRGIASPRAWMTLDPLDRLLVGPTPRLMTVPQAPAYPREEHHRGLEGDTYVLIKVGPNGEPADVRMLMSLPDSRGFRQVALKHAMASRWDPAPAPHRCAALAYHFRLRE
jgi:hypothetical protein